MGKYLRPRRTNEDKAIEKNILLRDGEMIMEYPADAAIGRSAGRIVIGNGNDKYIDKQNASTAPGDFKPFITDPSLYQPIYHESFPSEDYRYEDQDSGASILRTIRSGVTKLPKIIEIIKQTLCEHTDNIRYANERIAALEAKSISTDILDITYGECTFHVSSVTTPSIYISLTKEGYEFLTWINVYADAPVYPVCICNPTSKTQAYVKPINGTFVMNVNYTCTALFVKRNNAQ